LFHECESTVLVPYIEDLRTNEEFAGKETVLRMNNFSSHVQSDTLSVLAGHQVKAVTFPSYTSQIFQRLDRTLFGNCRKEMLSRVPREVYEIVTRFIKRIFHAMKQTLVKENVPTAFLQLGLQDDLEADRCVFRFEAHKLRQRPGLTSLWQGDQPEEKLSLPRWKAAFGWVNKRMCPEWPTREYSFISSILN
jgi:hypothetical protein